MSLLNHQASKQIHAKELWLTRTLKVLQRKTKEPKIKRRKAEFFWTSISYDTAPWVGASMAWLVQGEQAKRKAETGNWQMGCDRVDFVYSESQTNGKICWALYRTRTKICCINGRGGGGCLQAHGHPKQMATQTSETRKLECYKITHTGDVCPP